MFEPRSPVFSDGGWRLSRQVGGLAPSGEIGGSRGVGDGGDGGRRWVRRRADREVEIEEEAMTRERGEADGDGRG
jgi:hypothetical protein